MKKLLLALLCLTQPSFAEISTTPGRDIEYQELNKMLVFSKQIQSPYAKIKSVVTVKKQGLSLQDLQISLNIADQPSQAIIIDEQGSLTLPALDPQTAKRAKLHINQAKGDVSLSMSTDVMPPTNNQVPYHDLFILLEDTNKFMGEMAGMAAWFVPSMDRLKFTFAQPASIEINSANKRYQYHTDKNNVIEIKLKNKLLAENPLVVFSHLPEAMSPAD
jgi:hypothetical protein